MVSPVSPVGEFNASWLRFFQACVHLQLTQAPAPAKAQQVQAPVPAQEVSLAMYCCSLCHTHEDMVPGMGFVHPLPCTLSSYLRQ